MDSGAFDVGLILGGQLIIADRAGNRLGGDLARIAREGELAAPGSVGVLFQGEVNLAFVAFTGGVGAGVIAGEIGGQGDAAEQKQKRESGA